MTGLSVNSFGHRIKSKVFAGLGFQPLEDQYATHATEELDFVKIIGKQNYLTQLVIND